MKKIGIFGGAFDPVTTAHTFMARKLIELKVVDEIWFMPSHSYPGAKKMSPYATRCIMIELAVSKLPGIKLSMFESIWPEEISTYHLVKRLKEEYPDDSFYFIIGGDQTDNITNNWYKGRKVLKMIPFIIINRNEKIVQNFPNWCSKPPHQFIEEIYTDHISSTKVREAMHDEKLRNEFYEYLHPRVHKYIKHKNLYTKTIKQ